MRLSRNGLKLGRPPKLTSEQKAWLQRIRIFRKRWSNEALAAKYGVSESCIRDAMINRYRGE